MRKLQPLWIILIVCSVLTSGAVEPPAVSPHTRALAKIPCDALRLAGGGAPDAHGLVGHNRGGYRSPAFQRGAARFLLHGARCGDRVEVAEAFRAIDVVTAHQQSAGHFGGDATPSGVAFWLCELNPSLLALRESPLAPDFQVRLDALVPSIRRASAWLALPQNQERLLKEDAHAPNRLLFDALAYATSGRLCQDEDLVRLGRSFVDAALTQYRPADGVFLEKGGPDSSYQAVSAWHLQVWVLLFPDPKLESVADAAARWVEGRILPDGSVDTTGNTRTGHGQETWMGKPKDVNVPEVLRCLLYLGARRDDPSALAASSRVRDWLGGRHR